MATEPHVMPNPETPPGHDAVEMPRPTVAPMVLSLGLVLLAAGLALGPTFMLVGAVVLAFGLGLWITQLLPGRGHFHEALEEPERRPRPVTGVPGTVARMQAGMPGYRMRLPEKVHPITAGIKGGLIGGLVMPIPALAYGVLSGNSIWFPINLLAGMVLPGVGNMADAELKQFQLQLLLVGVVIHIIMAVIMGLIYGVLLPTLPAIPRGVAWSALFMPLLWTGASYILMGMVNPVMHTRVSWPWFILSQFVFGVVLATVASWAKGLGPLRSGLLGGLAGAVVMAVPAIFWGFAYNHGIWYPVNLLVGVVLPGLDALSEQELSQFHPTWFALAAVMHVSVSLAFGAAYALVQPKLPAIPGPIAWGGMLMPVLWTALSYAFMGVINPVLQDKVEWPWFVVSQFVFGVVAAIVVVRSEMVHIPPAGQGPDRVEEFVAG